MKQQQVEKWQKTVAKGYMACDKDGRESHRYHLEIKAITHQNLLDVLTPLTKHISQRDQLIKFHLYLSYNKIAIQGSKIFCLFPWHNLCILDLMGNTIEAKGCKYLMRCEFNNLTLLDLSKKGNIKGYNVIQAQGCRYLATSCMPKLKNLDLTGNLIRNEGLSYILKSSFKTLQRLCLNRNMINIHGCHLLFKSHWGVLTLQLKFNLLEGISDMLSQLNWQILL